MTDKKTVAVFFGGRSPEHDVSIVTGLQALQAIDQTKYDAFPVYITTEGRWLVGDALRERKNYLPDRTMMASLSDVTLDICAAGTSGRGRLLERKTGLFGGRKVIEFDVALPAFHGLIGEDGNLQGVFETAKIPYTGMRTMASSLTMDKGAAKLLMQSIGIPTLPFVVLPRPDDGYHISPQNCASLLSVFQFPVCVKPCHLGSSIGVAKCNTPEEVSACLPAIFKYDTSAIVEPFVENLVEYNVSVSRMGAGDAIATSALERPKNNAELLDFKQKYLSGGNDKSGGKMGGKSSEGMLSLTRELNPPLDPVMEQNIREWSARFYAAVSGTGAPRIDFIGNAQSGEIWMNEVNPCPGSFGYFLWEAAGYPILFTNLLTHLIEEALRLAKKGGLPADPVPMDARLHTRPT